jgi:hypothetical protein
MKDYHGAVICFIMMSVVTILASIIAIILFFELAKTMGVN